MDMKKLLAVTLLSMSVCTTSVGYSQSLYTVGSYHDPARLGTETNVGTENYAVWIFRGITFLSFLLALYAAWDDFERWLEDNEGLTYPDVYDPRIQGVCTFYYKYRYDYDLEGLQEALEDNDYCI